MLLWLAGTPGNEEFRWINGGNRGPVVYVVAVAGVGIFISLLSGVGMMEANRTQSPQDSPLNFAYSHMMNSDAVNEIEAENPGIFGVQGVYKRAVFASRMSWTLGTFIGPILSGSLSQRVGYYAMNCVLG